MRYLLDTHILIWLLTNPARMPVNVRTLLEDEENVLFFSPISIWEVAIKQRLGRQDLLVDAETLYREAISVGISELVLTGLQSLKTIALPFLHGDPFDRILLAQAIHENLIFITADKNLATYEGPFLRVKPT